MMILFILVHLSGPDDCARAGRFSDEVPPVPFSDGGLGSTVMSTLAVAFPPGPVAVASRVTDFVRVTVRLPVAATSPISGSMRTLLACCDFPFDDVSSVRLRSLQAWP